MTIKDIVPRLGKSRMPVRRKDDESLFSFQREVNRLFDEFFGGFGLAPAWDTRETMPTAFTPRVDIAETDKEIRVVAELPGLDEKDVVVEIDDETLTIRGERKEEHEEKGRNWIRTERSYGAFHRVIPLPGAVQEGQAKARFKKGVLTVTLPRKEGETSHRKAIAVTSED